MVNSEFKSKQEDATIHIVSSYSVLLLAWSTYCVGDLQYSKFYSQLFQDNFRIAPVIKIPKIIPTSLCILALTTHSIHAKAIPCITIYMQLYSQLQLQGWTQDFLREGRGKPSSEFHKPAAGLVLHSMILLLFYAVDFVIPSLPGGTAPEAIYRL